MAARALVGLSFGAGGVIAATQAMLTPPRYVGRAVAMVQAAQPIAVQHRAAVRVRLLIPVHRAARPVRCGRGPADGALDLRALAAVPGAEGRPPPASVMGRMGEVMQMAWARRRSAGTSPISSWFGRAQARSTRTWRCGLPRSRRTRPSRSAGFWARTGC